jgi:hypothetical protein
MSGAPEVATLTDGPAGVIGLGRWNEDDEVPAHALR